MAATTVKGFSPARLLAALAQFPAARHYRIAYSGGLDSHVLLHAMAQLHRELPGVALSAIHIDHGLQADSRLWIAQCAAVCGALGIPFQSLCVNALAIGGASPEAAAREARYAALAGLMETGDCLLTAQHQDDQAETLLLQLLRGAGPHGLAAMPRCTGFSEGYHARPLLEFSRAELHAYAVRHALHWIEDTSNLDTGFDRNYLRHAVMPALHARWPAMTRTLSRSAGHAADAACLLDTIAGNDLHAGQGSESGSLSLAYLRSLEPARQRNTLRAWLIKLNLPPPNASHIQRILNEMLPAAADSQPLLHWPGVEVRRYRELLYAMKPLAGHAAGQRYAWNMQTALMISGIGQLNAKPALGAGLKQSLCLPDTLSIRFRQGGERCRPAGRRHSHELKKLLQEHSIPPWRRDRLPLVFIGEELAAVADLWVCEPFQAEKNEPGRLIVFDGN